jgi:probable DNA metabolism protein
MIYIFDASLEGLLTAVFESFERKHRHITLVTAQSFQPDAFAETFTVINNRKKADRVWSGFGKKLDRGWMRKFYCAYLSELPKAYQSLFDFAVYVFSHTENVAQNYGNADVLAISKYARSVEREKHRMEAFIRFQKTADGMFYCAIDPDFNVLPLIVKHFADRYASQQWIIYDIKRNYGLFYNLHTVEEITLEASKQELVKPSVVQLDAQEMLYANLWKDYFKSTNIESRKNTKLHVQHVPKRYWKYLTEKQPHLLGSL